MLAMMAVEAVIPDRDASHAGSASRSFGGLVSLSLCCEIKLKKLLAPYKLYQGCVFLSLTLEVSECTGIYQVAHVPMLAYAISGTDVAWPRHVTCAGQY
eukprot:1639622-Rhodomonas_salina.1